MVHMQVRIAKLEGHLGGDEIDRWVRALTDEQLAEEIASLGAELRGRLTAFGVRCEDMAIDEVAQRLEALETAEAGR